MNAHVGTSSRSCVLVEGSEVTARGVVVASGAATGAGVAAGTDVGAAGVQALATPPLTVTPELQQMLHQSVIRTIQRRMLGRALPGGPPEK